VGVSVVLSYVILAVLLVILVALFSSFRPSATQKITDNLYVVRCIFVNFYAYVVGTDTIIFDTGISENFAKRGLKKLGISPDSVTHVFLTHSDFDHASALNAFKGAKVYLAKAEVPMVTGEIPRRVFVYNNKLSSFNALKDGETVKIGNSEIKVYVTPGHTIGSASYLVDNRLLITGDLLRISRSGKIKPFLMFMNMNHKQDIKSVEMMQKTIGNAEYVLTGHTGFYKLPSK